MGLKLNATNGGGSVELDVPDTVNSDLVLTLPATDGDADQFLQTNGSGALSFADPLGSAAAVSGTNFQFNSGFGSVATAYGCRAWVNFNGTGTVAIRASGNVSSITDTSVGRFTVNFTTSLPDSNYAAVCSGGSTTISSGMGYMYSPTTSGTGVEFVSGQDLLMDPVYATCAVFR